MLLTFTQTNMHPLHRTWLYFYAAISHELIAEKELDAEERRRLLRLAFDEMHETLCSLEDARKWEKKRHISIDETGLNPEEVVAALDAESDEDRAIRVFNEEISE